ncbi:hypothetical protein L798_11562 [Zootermopsis nevadensis]|uniref:Uncharacterized protein n=1 Tax=Zootermopsis nevadensis TaxID=136037 RepID=A0A067RUX8_ZOONE|nr:hypothetical protein L798_11562 [Zootermopsis nevadensis]
MHGGYTLHYRVCKYVCMFVQALARSTDIYKICTWHIREASLPHARRCWLALLTSSVGICGRRVPLHRHVALHVEGQVVGARERPLAEAALERAVAGVLAVVASQLVRARELPTAALPAALVRLLARVRAEVSLEVRRLRVRLAAARLRARVHDYFPPAPVPPGWYGVSGMRLRSQKRPRRVL